MNEELKNETWPAKDIETLNCCAACSHPDICPELIGVQDLSFRCAPGLWNFWRCKSCESLFLNPRPTMESISDAYRSYYTHYSVTVSSSWFQKFVTKIRNEYDYHWFHVNKNPRFNFKSRVFLLPLLPFLKKKFPLERLNNLPRGSLLDVGAGNGDFIEICTDMGHLTEGLEIDQYAVKFAKSRGIQVEQASFEHLYSYDKRYDYVTCLHVMEHVHYPANLITMMLRVLKPGGKLFISWPNPHSFLLRWFGKYWRGLEAPRHLTLYSKSAISVLLNNLQVTAFSFIHSPAYTFSASWVMSGRNNSLGIRLFNKALFGVTSQGKTKHTEDFICIEITK